MQMPGPTELILVLLIVLIIFGASRLPEIGKGLGKMLREFKKATGEDTGEKKLEEKQENEQQ